MGLKVELGCRDIGGVHDREQGPIGCWVRGCKGPGKGFRDNSGDTGWVDSGRGVGREQDCEQKAKGFKGG